MSELALSLIAENARTRAAILDLSNCGMTKIPEQVNRLVWLEELIIGGEDYYDHESETYISSANKGSANLISRLPEGFGNLQRLKRLVINGTYDRSLGLEDLSELGKLPGLFFLSISFASVSDTSILSRLATLQTLDLISNNIIDISSLSNLENLQRLALSNNRLSDLNPLSSLLRLRELYLSANQVTSIAPLSTLVNLLKLRFDDNKVTDLSFLANLTSLRELNLSLNPVTDLSSLSDLVNLRQLKFDETKVIDIAPVSKLKNLEAVYFRRNRVIDVSPLSNLTGLQQLLFGKNMVTSISSLSGLATLQALDFSSNNVKDISAISTLSWLQALDLSGNLVTDIATLAGLTHLQRLDFSSNNVADISCLSGFTNLKVLAFQDCLVTSLVLLLNLPSLSKYYCSGCPIADCPADVYETGDPKQLRAYFKAHEIQQSSPAPKEARTLSKSQIRRENADNMDLKRDVKLIVLGNSNAGKTNLVNYLMDNVFNGIRNTTHGLEVHRWLPDAKRFPALRDIAVSIWDFGGQEYYHGAYRLFLSANALYLLLWCNESNVNGRRKTRLHDDELEIDLEHFELKYWLDTIRHYSGGKANIALITVQNKTDEANNTGNPKMRIAQEVHDKYGIYDSFHISLYEGADKHNVRQYNSLKHFLSELEYLIERSADKASIPLHWQRIRNEILSLKASKRTGNHFAEYIQYDLWISTDDFEKACKKFNTLSLTPDEVHTLPRWLDKGGVVVYFPDLPQLQNRLFLRPDLLAKKLYEILNNEVLTRGGEFTADEIFTEENSDVKPVFLEIAQHLELIFAHPVIGKESYFISPQYLPDNYPELFKIASKDTWESAFWVKVPLFYYKKILHGLLLHFAGDTETECRYFWKHGIMFLKENLRVLLKGLYPEEDEHDGTIMIGVEKDGQKQQLLQKEIFDKILELLKANDKTGGRPMNKAAAGEKKAPESAASMQDKLRLCEDIEIQISYDGVNYVDYRNLLQNAAEPKIRSSDGHVWLIPQQFAPMIPFTPPRAKRVFLSYSHQNTSWLGRLRTHLAGLRRAKEIETWDDKEIFPGDLWDATIKKNLEEADVFILLLSADFVASEYIWNYELRFALERFRERKATVIPVLLEPFDFGSLSAISTTDDHSSVKISDFEIIPKNADGRLQAVSLWSNQEQALAEVAEKIRAAIKR